MKAFLRKFLSTILLFFSFSFLYSSVPWELCLNKKITTLEINLKKGGNRKSRYKKNSFNKRRRNLFYKKNRSGFKKSSISGFV